MTLTIELDPNEELQLAAAARLEGVDPAELARQLVVKHLPSITGDGDGEDPTLALFAQWEREDAQMTPEAMEDAQREFEEFRQSLNAERARAEARPIYL